MSDDKSNLNKKAADDSAADNNTVDAIGDDNKNRDNDGGNKKAGNASNKKSGDAGDKNASDAGDNTREVICIDDFFPPRVPRLKQTISRFSARSKRMPRQRMEIPLDVHYTAEQVKYISIGFIPYVMEEKWHVYFTHRTEAEEIAMRLRALIKYGRLRPKIEIVVGDEAVSKAKAEAAAKAKSADVIKSEAAAKSDAKPNGNKNSAAAADNDATADKKSAAKGDDKVDVSSNNDASATPAAASDDANDTNVASDDTSDANQPADNSDEDDRAEKFTCTKPARLVFHRSWTGVCAYTVHFEPHKDGMRATKLVVNIKPRQWQDINLADPDFASEQAKQVLWLIDVLLLERPPVGLPSGRPITPQSAVAAFSIAGQAIFQNPNAPKGEVADAINQAFEEQ